MTESDERLTRLIENDAYATYHEWAKYLETPTGQLRVTVQDTSDYGDGRPMHVELHGHGLFEISVSVKRLPGGDRWRECAQCNDERHSCPGCGEDIEHGEHSCCECSDRAPRTPVDVPARADWLAEGDQIFSDATGQWHEVISASTHGTTTLVIDRNNGSTFQFKVRPEQIFTARRASAGLLIDTLGGEVIHSA